MENEWRELQIDNLPPDILTGDYEFRWSPDDDPFESPEIAIHNFLGNNKLLFYRKKQLETPSHEEIISKWWKCDDNTWRKVLGYDHSFSGNVYTIKDATHLTAWFTGRESDDIPPEA